MPLPSLPKTSSSEIDQANQVQSLKSKSNLKQVKQLVGIDFGKVDVEGLESYEKALEAYESEAYQKALKVLDGGADRDFRIFEGV